MIPTVRGQYAVAAAAALALILLLVGGWLLGVALTSPGLLYASTAGNRLAEKDPALVPAWWFAAFPDPGHLVTNSQAVALAEDSSTTATQGNSTMLTASAQLPPGMYTATFAWSCNFTSPTPQPAPLSLTVVRVIAGHPVLAQRAEPQTTCDGAPHADNVPLFASDGYDTTRFYIGAPAGTRITEASVSYAPSSD